MKSSSSPWVKICGITNANDALLALSAGADAIGLNFVSASKRCIDLTLAREIAEAVGGRLELIGVVADQPAPRLEDLMRSVPLDWLQLHGQESAADVLALPRAFKAIAIGSAEDAALAASYPGERLLVDAKVRGTLGGSGTAFDWSLVHELSATRKLIVAGGLTPANVASAVLALRPFGVDVASGVEVEGDPRRKDALKVRAFVNAARQAAPKP